MATLYLKSCPPSAAPGQQHLGLIYRQEVPAGSPGHGVGMLTDAQCAHLQTPSARTACTGARWRPRTACAATRSTARSAATPAPGPTCEVAGCLPGRAPPGPSAGLSSAPGSCPAHLGHTQGRWKPEEEKLSGSGTRVCARACAHSSVHTSTCSRAALRPGGRQRPAVQNGTSAHQCFCFS